MTVNGVQRSTDVLNLTKYVTGAAINQNGESSGIVAGTAIFSGLKGGVWAWKNRGNYRAGLQALTDEMNAHKALMQGAAKKGSGFLNTVKNFWNGGAEIVSKGKLEALAKGTDSAALAAQKVLASGKNFAEGLKAIEGGKGILKTIGKGIKGNAWFAGISFGIGVLTDVIPAFQLGSDRGFKQLGKTAVKTGAEVGGWAAGSALGAKAGAAIGACVGGPVGAAIGGIVGVVCGFLGSFLCSKAADAIVGPSEVELAQEEQAREIAQQATAQGDSAISEIAQAAYNQLLQNAAENGGELSEDDLAAKKSLENLIGEKIDIKADLEQLSSTDAQQQTAASQPLTQTQAQTQTLAQATSAQAPSQHSQRVQDDLPGTSASLYGMSMYNPMAMPAIPYTSYSGVNPFASSNPFTSYSGFNYPTQNLTRPQAV